MSIVHHQIEHHPTRSLDGIPARPARCFRHRVWMAACDDCRDAHRERVAAGRRRGASGR